VSPAILIIKPSSLGDVAVALAVVPALRAHYPDAAIDWLANSEYADLVAAAAHIRRVYAFERGQWRRIGGIGGGLRNLVRLVRDLRRAKYDIVIDLQGLLRSACFTCLTGAPIRVGFANAREGAHLAYNRRVAADRDGTHAVDCCMAAVEALTGERYSPRWEWRELEGEAATVRTALGTRRGEYFVCVLGSRWQSKCWAVSHVADAVRGLWERYHQPVVLSGAESEAAIAESVINAVQAAGCPAEAVINAAGKLSLVELLELFRDSRAVITPDSGPMHLAIAAGAQVVAVMGPTNPVRHGPYGQLEHVVVAPRAHAPCYRRVCLHSEPCMTMLPAEDVLVKVDDVLTGR
jgi:heptosyltransferase-1